MSVQASSLSPLIIREHLLRVLASRTFARAGYLRRFLELCVSETLQGNSGHLKEIWLGGEVFGRRDDFNPGIDPIVRVQARRLREKLTLFYQTEGRGDHLRITLPVGSYVPVFSTSAHYRDGVGQPNRAFALAVLPLRALDNEADSLQISDTVTSELAGSLTKLGGLRMVSRFAGLDTDFVVMGTVRAGSSSHQVLLQVRDYKTGQDVWNAWFEREARGCSRTCGASH